MCWLHSWHKNASSNSLMIDVTDHQPGYYLITLIFMIVEHQGAIEPLFITFINFTDLPRSWKIFGSDIVCWLLTAWHVMTQISAKVIKLTIALIWDQVHSRALLHYHTLWHQLLSYYSIHCLVPQSLLRYCQYTIETFITAILPHQNISKLY